MQSQLSHDPSTTTTTTTKKPIVSRRVYQLSSIVRYSEVGGSFPTALVRFVEVFNGDAPLCAGNIDGTNHKRWVSSISRLVIFSDADCPLYRDRWLYYQMSVIPRLCLSVLARWFWWELLSAMDRSFWLVAPLMSSIRRWLSPVN